MKYKRSNGANNMSLTKSILIDEKTLCDFKKSGNKSISDFHNVTLNFDKKHLGKVLDSEIIKVWEQVEKDYNDGTIVAATMGVELDGERRHLHVSKILSQRALTAVTGARYRRLIAKERRAKPRIYIRNGKEVKTYTTVVASQPEGLKGGVRHLAYNWLAYPLKELAKDFNDINVFARDVNFTNCDDFKTIGIFDGSNNDERRREKFACSVFMSWQKKISKVNGEPETIYTGDRLPTQAMEFMESVGIDAVWNVEGDRKASAMNQAKIITKMVLNNIGKKRYNLASNFFGNDKEGKNTYRLVMGLKPLPNRTSQDYEKELHSAILKNRATALGVSIESKVEKRLISELSKLKKKYESLENVCKGHVVTIQKLKGDHRSKARDRKIRELTRTLKEEEDHMKRRIRENRNNRHFVEDWSLPVSINEQLEALKAERENDLTKLGVYEEEEATSGRKRQRVEDDINQDGIMEFRLPRAE